MTKYCQEKVLGQELQNTSAFGKDGELQENKNDHGSN